MEYCKNFKNHPWGFTIIEFIAILLIIAIVAVITISRFTSTTPYKVASEVEILKANLRYAQFRALSDADIRYGLNEVTWGISLSTNSYTLQKDRTNGANKAIYFPSENSSTHNFPSGINIATGAGTTITYNAWGIPVNASNTSVTGNITITDGASLKTITVTANTGFIP
jgi:type II secretory pathway pseudopilin PulG